MKWPWLLVIGACTPRIDPPMPPPRPVVVLPESSASSPWVDPLVVVKVEAAEAESVVLFVDAECRGTPLLRDSSERFRAGVELEVVHGPNVFSAKAIDSQGLASSCSAPETLEVVKLARGSTTAPLVTRIEPMMPTQRFTGTLFGVAPAGFRVRVWSRPLCQGSLVSTGNGFGDAGLAVALSPNDRLEVSLDGVRGTELTLCSTPHVLVNDITPPLAVEGVVFPSQVDRGGEQFFVVKNDPDSTEKYGIADGPSCEPAKTMLQFGFDRVCSGIVGSVCHRILGMPPLSSPRFSVWRVDLAGNASCTTLISPARDGGSSSLSTLRLHGGTSDNLYAATTHLAPGLQFFEGTTCFGISSFADLQPTPTLYVKVGVLSGSPWSAQLWNPNAPDGGECQVIP